MAGALMLRRSSWFDRAARAGLAAKGVSFGLVAVLAILVALGRGGKTTGSSPGSSRSRRSSTTRGTPSASTARSPAWRASRTARRCSGSRRPDCSRTASTACSKRATATSSA